MTSGSSRHQGRERWAEIDKSPEGVHNRGPKGKYKWVDGMSNTHYVRALYKAWETKTETAVFRPAKSKENK